MLSSGRYVQRPREIVKADRAVPAAFARSQALGVFIIAVVGHVLVVVFVHLFTSGRPLFPDALGYELSSNTIARLWSAGQWLDTSDLASIVGSEIWGYPAMMAGARFLTGGGWLGAKVILALVSASAAPAAYGLALTAKVSQRRAVVVGIAVGLSPNLLLWDAWGLRDSLLVSLVLWVLLVQVRGHFWIAVGVTLLAVQVALYLRPTVAVFIAAALLARLRLRARHLVVGGVGLVIGLLFLLPRTNVLVDLIDTVQIESSRLTFTGGESTNIIQHPQYLGRFFFGPFPWAFDEASSGPDRWQYIGTVIWIGCLAFLPTVCVRAWKDTDGIGRSMLVGGVAYGSIYLAAFGSAFYRQRSLLQCLLLILVLVFVPVESVVALKKLTIWLGAVALVPVFHGTSLLPSMSAKAAAAAIIFVTPIFFVIRADRSERKLRPTTRAIAGQTDAIRK